VLPRGPGRSDIYGFGAGILAMLIGSFALGVEFAQVIGYVPVPVPSRVYPLPGRSSTRRYRYKAKVYRVVDGDTVDARIDLGFGVSVDRRLRLLRVDTPEMRGGSAESKRVAKAARAHLVGVLVGGEVEVQSSGSDSFGRCLSEVWYREASRWVNLGDELLDEGLAEPYDE